jgi:hypothetical protein
VKPVPRRHRSLAIGHALKRAAIAFAIVVVVSCKPLGLAPPASVNPSMSPRSSTSPGQTVPPPPSPRESQSPPASASPPLGSLSLGPLRQFPLEGEGQSGLSAFGDSIVYSAAPWQGTTRPRPGAGEIRERVLATGALRILYRAGDEAAAVSVKASASWLAWLEHADRFGLSDARLFAAPRAGGLPMLIDDIRAYPNPILFPMWTLDGAHLYWTIPQMRDGRLFGDLKHKRLPDGPVETVVGATPGELIALPSAYGGYLGYEVRSDSGGPRVMLRRADGTTHEVATPASEPTVGDGFIAFKKAPAAIRGTLAALIFSSGRIVELGVGEQPEAGGRWLTWAKMPEPGHPYGSVFVSRADFSCVAPFAPPTPNANSSISKPSFAGDVGAWIVSNYEPPQTEYLLVVGELRDLRC